MQNKEITRASYEATAHEFAQNVAELAPMQTIKDFVSLLPPHANIIDIGCGSGRDAKIFTAMGVNVLGIDFCPKMIEIASEHAPLAEFKVMDVEEMHLPEASFDGAWVACTVNHIDRTTLPRVLKSINNLLKDKAYLYLAVKTGTGEGLEHDKRYEGNFEKFWCYYEEDEIRKQLETAGFKILHFELVGKISSYHTHSAFKILCQKN